MSNNPKAEASASAPKVLGVVHEVGSLRIPAEKLAAMPASEYNARGVVLESVRSKLTIDVNGIPTEFTVSTYIQRAPVNDDERSAVAKVADTRKADKSAKEKAQADTLAREKRAMFELGQSAMTEALRNVSTLQQAANALKTAIG